MTTLLDLKQTIKSFYVKYEFYITLVWKFVLSLIGIGLINSKLGYQSALTSPIVVLMCALLCAIMPKSFIVIICAVFVIVHFAALSTEVALLALVCFLMMYLLYYRFSPKDTLAVILTPICFCLHIPYVIPIGLGFFGTPASVISILFGSVTYYFIEYINVNVNSFRTSTDEAADTVTRLQSVMEGVFKDHTMISVIVVFMIAMLVVYFIRRMAIDYSFDIAIIAGCLIMMIGLIIASIGYDVDISMVGVILGCVVSGLIMKAIEFFSFNLDYNRAENVQFEDDEYYYYVKAVPKVTVPEPNRKVKQINRTKKLANEENDTPKKSSSNVNVVNKTSNNESKKATVVRDRVIDRSKNPQRPVGSATRQTTTRTGSTNRSNVNTQTRRTTNSQTNNTPGRRS